jgi:hypothetical protein
MDVFMLTGETNDGEWIVACMRVSQKGEGIWGAVSVGVVVTAVVVVVTENQIKIKKCNVYFLLLGRIKELQEAAENGTGNSVRHQHHWRRRTSEAMI